MSNFSLPSVAATLSLRALPHTPSTCETCSVLSPDGSVRTIEVIGRNAWALRNLIEAGERGCTPLDHPAPRWSSYVHRLRAMGLVIVTTPEPHGGPYKGMHARYVLKSVVRRIGPGEAAEPAYEMQS